MWPDWKRKIVSDAGDAMRERELIAELKARRIARGITLREASDLCGLLPSTIWRIEAGRSTSVRLNSVIVYAESLDLKVVLIEKPGKEAIKRSQLIE
jgi:transcriptional regulator with XRE-family HTH domain